MGDEIQETQEEEQHLRNSDRFEGSVKSMPVNDDDTENEVARKMTSSTAGGEEDDPTGSSKPSKIIKKKEEQETATDKKEAVEKPDLKRRRDVWEQSHVEDSPSAVWDLPDSTPGSRMWDATTTTARIGDATPSVNKKFRRVADQSHDEVSPSSDWDIPGATPTPGRIDDGTPLAKKKLPRVADSDVNPAAGVTPDPIPAGMSWDATPKLAGLATMGSATPPAAAYSPGVTPVGGVEPIPDAINTLANLWEKVDEERNRPLTDEEFNAMFLLLKKDDVPEEIPDGLPFMEPKDYQYFGSLLNKVDEEALSPDEQEEQKIMKLLLELKNGTLHKMKTALRQLIDYAREFGAGPIFNRILPLLMHPTLNNQERHLLVKVISRVLYELDELVRPYVYRILVVIESLLMNEDYNVRAEGTEIIYNLSKAAGLNTMIDALHPDIHNIDEYVTNATARSFGVVASALGIAALLPFVKEVCQSSNYWKGRHTGFMIVHQIIIFIGPGVLPHLRPLVEIIKPGVNDENQKVRIVTTLALAALNKFAAQYGIKI